MKRPKRLSFVLQKHLATHLHYDFRLEFHGVMKSWVLPKGPSINPRVRCLAILTKDHALSYKNFEGVIATGKYGAGVVMVWDRGTYVSLKKNQKNEYLSIESCLRRGILEIELRGKKLKGKFALVRMEKKNWLLIKMKDAYASASVDIIKSKTRSVKSNKTLKQIERKFESKSKP